MKTRVCLILPYFGKFKEYFNLFLASCRNNPEITWLIFTDNRDLIVESDNIRVYYYDFSDFSARIQSNFDFKISLEKPYKLCDFKVAYGDIFQEEIKEFDYWGHCNCDLIFGRFSSFLNDEILQQYDKIFTRGHLTLYRNSPEVNKYYRTQTAVDYRTVFQSPQSFSFDEWAGISRIWKQDGKKQYDALVFDDIRVGLESIRPTKEISGSANGPYHEQIDESQHYARMLHIAYRYEHETGKLYRVWNQVGRKQNYCEEVLYVHLQKRNMCVDSIHSLGDFWIVPNKFIGADKNKLPKDCLPPRRYTTRDTIYLGKCFFRKLFRR